MSAVVCFVDNCGRGESHPSHHERSAQNVLRAFRSGVAPSGAKLRLLQTGMWTCSAEDWGTPVVLPDSARFSGFTALSVACAGSLGETGANKPTENRASLMFRAAPLRSCVALLCVRSSSSRTIVTREHRDNL